jgi:hypothetical protein
MARADALEQRLAHTEASREASARETATLQAQLAESRTEIARLRALFPGNVTVRFAPTRYALVTGLAMLAATAMAGSLRETFGIAMSYFAVAPFAFAAGAMIGARRSHAAAYAAGAVAIPIGIALLFVFYTAIWPSL